MSVKGVNFEPCPNRYARGEDKYVDKNRYLYSNRIAKLLEEKGCLEDIVARLSKYFDQILIDEIQDLAGNDFNLLKALINTDAEMICVGDFYQHTYDTGRDGNVNRNLHREYEAYQGAFENIGFDVDLDALKKSYRCSPTVCEFVSRKIGIQIESHREDTTAIACIVEQDVADRLFHDDRVVKLFYQDSHKYYCHSNNWGNSKGEDTYGDVCVVLNKATLAKFKEDQLPDLPPTTKNKLYVAITRTRNDLYFVSHLLYDKYKGIPNESSCNMESHDIKDGGQSEIDAS
jgi:ATP-dependent exoDNAse (exonuclease V) beta subunit